MQKLYTDDVCRNGSYMKWWYSGITLEYAPPDLVNSAYDIVATPVEFIVQYKGANPCVPNSIRSKQFVVLPALVVCLAHDQQYISPAFNVQDSLIKT